mmetsp:Transcript_21344/g.60886  ORF Transcript_21344/g.60886 Transcript_21344/m.60886 type:complete len:208 (+) Transcript_21344:640-1263(+)
MVVGLRLVGESVRRLGKESLSGRPYLVAVPLPAVTIDGDLLHGASEKVPGCVFLALVPSSLELVGVVYRLPAFRRRRGILPRFGQFGVPSIGVRALLQLQLVSSGAASVRGGCRQPSVGSEREEWRRRRRLCAAIAASGDTGRARVRVADCAVRCLCCPRHRRCSVWKFPHALGRPALARDRSRARVVHGFPLGLLGACAERGLRRR